MDKHGDLLNEFIDLIEKISPVPVVRTAIGRETDFIDDLLLDSIAFVSLIALAEEFYERGATGFGAIDAINTVGDALDMIANSLGRTA